MFGQINLLIIHIYMEEEINYSIIIPHKNIPALLQQCLNSIPRRGYSRCKRRRFLS
jgi:hypothetical protein